MKVKNALYITLTAILCSAITMCSGSSVNVGKDDTGREYINSTGNLKQSKEKLEDAPAYEVYFTLDKTVECISVSLETVSVPRKSTEDSVPVKSYFVVEKLMELKSGTGRILKTYIQNGKNYNSRWEVHNPLKICGNTADPVSRLGASVFRIRFTTFDTKHVYFTVTVYTETGVKFSPDPAMLTGEGVPVK